MASARGKCQFLVDRPQAAGWGMQASPVPGLSYYTGQDINQYFQ